jgi:hypothetical protein
MGFAMMKTPIPEGQKKPNRKERERKTSPRGKPLLFSAGHSPKAKWRGESKYCRERPVKRRFDKLLVTK